MTENRIALSLKNISYSYKENNAPVIKDFSLDVTKGSFTTLLGPSGCGKTTLLRLISGFLVPSSGTIELNGISQKGIEPDKRKIGMVFQDYALFPHMSVKQNILFGLKLKYDKASGKKLSKDVQEEKAAKIAENLDLQNLLDRYPNELSGGQQQRVALARALVLDPEILLMDEPLSSLDTKLREKVREELKTIQQKLKITTVYVTHDQEEALSLSDKIAVINDGSLLQYGTPRELYFKPQDNFTADFVGRANFVSLEGETYIIRPEWFELNKTEKQGIVEGKVVSASFLGDRTRFVIAVSKIEGSACSVSITADLPTLETNFLEKDGSVSLNVSHKWKI
ncbi:MAG: ABC transporter ATP-binding protein [Spirochaetaceae bacterium]|nr:ABC transporter ATP-binding protein [Spirochaetaceae bacterium]